MVNEDQVANMPWQSVTGQSGRPAAPDTEIEVEDIAKAFSSMREFECPVTQILGQLIRFSCNFEARRLGFECGSIVFRLIGRKI